jgi:hypothetical protein
VKLINEGVVEQAVKLGLADAKVVVADLTAQEAAIPHPNEMGLLGGFVRSLEAAAGKAGHLFKRFLAKSGNKFRAAKEQVRKYRLFAKDKTKAAKDKMVAQMASIVAGINQHLGKVLVAASGYGHKLRGQALVARRKLGEWHETMSKLVPPDSPMAAHRLRRRGQDHQPAHPRTLFGRPGQSRQVCRVRAVLGNHAAAYAASEPYLA